MIIYYRVSVLRAYSLVSWSSDFLNGHLGKLIVA